ncbi:hypothetical protein M5K25_010521 [Dendrobium thyrsiflorum]|uniref:Uncharacterized protein n=1 Tax=Dendrobium thyrsiflorum TaxID=117978 RepID=A0ABD0V0B0_DENTH
MCGGKLGTNPQSKSTRISGQVQPSACIRRRLLASPAKSSRRPASDAASCSDQPNSSTTRLQPTAPTSTLLDTTPATCSSTNCCFHLLLRPHSRRQFPSQIQNPTPTGLPAALLLQSTPSPPTSGRTPAARPDDRLLRPSRRRAQTVRDSSPLLPIGLLPILLLPSLSISDASNRSLALYAAQELLQLEEYEDKSKGKIISGKDEWQTAISKKIMKMIKQLEGVPGIKWKSSTEPVLELKGNPNSGASTFRSLTWKRSKTKRFYKTSSKKSGSSNKHSKLKEKRTVLQKIINNLEDYRQPVR